MDDIDASTPFVEKLAYVLMEMADCTVVPENLGDPLLERLFHEADTSRMNTDMRDDYMKSIMSETDYEYHMDGAREEGFDEGYSEGRAEGRAEGREEGRAEGRAEGRESALNDVAEKLASLGLSPEVIRSVVGKSERE